MLRGALQKVLRRVLRSCLAARFTGTGASERGSQEGFWGRGFPEGAEHAMLESVTP